jgi:hypothetical protein
MLTTGKGHYVFGIREAHEYTFIVLSLKNPISVMFISCASVTASDDGAETAHTIGI